MDKDLKNKDELAFVQINHTDEFTFSGGWASRANIADKSSPVITLMHTRVIGENQSTTYATDVERDAVIGEIIYF